MKISKLHDGSFAAFMYDGTQIGTYETLDEAWSAANRFFVSKEQRSAAPSHRESDDTYAGVVATLNAKWRVVVCRDNLQWILQRRDGERRGGARWTGRSYCRTREALIRVCREHAGEIHAVALTILQAVPERLP